MTTFTQLQVIGWGGNCITGSFGDFFGNDDDDTTVFFPAAATFDGNDGNENIDADGDDERNGDGEAVAMATEGSSQQQQQWRDGAPVASVQVPSSLAREIVS